MQELNATRVFRHTVEWFGNEVDPARVEGMATNQTRRTQEEPAQHAVLLNRFDGVL